jgi:hypothetical protein
MILKYNTQKVRKLAFISSSLNATEIDSKEMPLRISWKCIVALTFMVR